jgi:hypothetical protein
MSQHLLKHQIQQLYRLLLRSSSNFPTDHARQFAIKWIREEFRKYRDAPPAKARLLFQRAVNVLFILTKSKKPF